MDTDAVRSGTARHRSEQVEELPLPADKTAAGLARGFVREKCPRLDEGALDDVTLVVSELVSNAVRHGQPAIVLRMRVRPFAVDLSVLDHGAAVPSTEIVPPCATATSGRGLSIVDRLATNWGVEPLVGVRGKTVWARLRRDVPLTS